MEQRDESKATGGKVSRVPGAERPKAGHKPSYMTCGTCGRTWDDALVSGMTPVPSGRCPFEYDHEEEEEPEPRIPYAALLAERDALREVLAELVAARESVTQGQERDLYAKWLPKAQSILATSAARKGGAS